MILNLPLCGVRIAAIGMVHGSPKTAMKCTAIAVMTKNLPEGGKTISVPTEKGETMDNTRKKLIELLKVWHNWGYEESADYLIANGVTLDNQVASSKWISVKDRLPTMDDADEAGVVLVYTENNEQLIIDTGYVWRFRDFITHWMPLPEPPKGE